MRRAGNARLLGYAVLAAIGMVGALALRRPELAIVAGPFALVLVAGTRGSDPGVEAELALATERTLEGSEIEAVMTVRAARPVDRVELLLELPQGMEVVDGSATRSLRLRAGEERDLPFVLRCTTWGVYEPGDVSVRARDAFRLVTWETRSDDVQAPQGVPEPAHVAPTPRAVGDAGVRGQSGRAEKGDGVEYADIRDFVPGDRVRSINWRASARRQGLVVNERHPERNTDVVLFVDSFTDVGGAAGSVLEEAVRAAASLANHYLEHRDRVGLVGFGGVLRWLQPGMGMTQRYRLIETLLETGVEPTYTWQDVSVIPARILPPKSFVLALTPLVDPRFCAALEDLRGRRFDVAVIEVDPVRLVESGRSTLERVAYRLWLLEREVQRSRLEGRGIGFATWGDGDLESALEEVRTFRRYARPVRA